MACWMKLTNKDCFRLREWVYNTVDSIGIGTSSPDESYTYLMASYDFGGPRHLITISFLICLLLVALRQKPEG